MQALEVLVAIMEDPEQPASARILAAKTIIEQANGRPFQAVQVDAVADKSVQIKWDADMEDCAK